MGGVCTGGTARRRVEIHHESTSESSKKLKSVESIGKQKKDESFPYPDLGAFRGTPNLYDSGELYMSISRELKPSTPARTGGNKEAHCCSQWGHNFRPDYKNLGIWKTQFPNPPVALIMDESAGVEVEYHHKNNRVYCWKGLRFSARQDLEGFSRFTQHGIEGVVPLELLPIEVRAKYQAKPSERTKRTKKEGTRNSAQQAEENQIATPPGEVDNEVGRADPEASAAPTDTDAVIGDLWSGSEGGSIKIWP